VYENLALAPDLYRDNCPPLKDMVSWAFNPAAEALIPMIVELGEQDAQSFIQQELSRPEGERKTDEVLARAAEEEAADPGKGERVKARVAAAPETADKA
jgi:hypothetical protein